jgi:exopolysaccharide biosynthesis polyprenyl glycosylphosphotransferase
MTSLEQSPPAGRSTRSSAANQREELAEPTTAAHLYSVEDLVSDRTRDLIRKRRFGRTRRRGWLIKRALATADVMGLLCAFVVAEAVFGPEPQRKVDIFGPEAEFIGFALSLPFWLLIARAYGLYDRDEARTDHSTVDDMFGVFNMVTVGAWAFFVVAWQTGVAHPNVSKLFLFWAASIVLVGVARGIARTVCRRTDSYVQNTVIVGAGHVGQQIARKLLQHPEYGVNIVGFVDEHPRARNGDLEELTVLGKVSELPDLVRLLDVERVIIAFSRAPHEEALATIRQLNGLDVQVDVVPRLFEVLGPQTTVHGAEGLPLLGLPAARLAWSSLVLKRGMDITASAAGLVLLAPVLAVIAIAIRRDTRGPVFFQQVRMGKGDRPFRILKFRTMTADADERKHEIAHLNRHSDGDDRMFKIPDDPRTTRVGRFLRKYSLDELPQLVNVLKGDMSLVGPRPLIPDEHRHVDGWAERRLDLKPGMTGLWQVLGRDDIPFGEMVGLDYRYVTTWSLAEDIRLLFRTIPVMAGRRGASL